MKKYIIAVLILVVSFLGITACSSNKAETIWKNVKLGEFLPKPKSDEIEILTNDKDVLSIIIQSSSIDDYIEYENLCTSKYGFTIDIVDSPYHSEVSSFYGYNQEGYCLSLNYNGFEEKFRIELEAPRVMTEYNLPDFAIDVGLPMPTSNKGDCYQTEKWFCLYVGETTLKDYNEYKNKCIDAGFTIDAKEIGDFYSAKNIDGYELKLDYEGFDIIYIEMSCPEIIEESPFLTVTNGYRFKNSVDDVTLVFEEINLVSDWKGIKPHNGNFLIMKVNASSDTPSNALYYFPYIIVDSNGTEYESINSDFGYNYKDNEGNTIDISTEINPDCVADKEKGKVRAYNTSFISGGNGIRYLVFDIPKEVALNPESYIIVLGSNRSMFANEAPSINVSFSEYVTVVE